MSQIIKIPIDLRNFRSNDGNADYYLAVNKNLNSLRKGDDVVLWSTERGREGIFGYGRIVTNLLKPSEINENVYDRNSLQIGVVINYIHFLEPIIPKNFAKKLPSINELKQPIVISNSLNYWGSSIISEVKTFAEDFRHIFSLSSQVGMEQYEYVIHLLREKHQIIFDYRSYSKKLTDSNKICEFCDVNFGKKYGLEFSNRFLELHEIPTLNQTKYKKIDISDFKVICSNCHKIEHEKMRIKQS